MKYYYYCNSWEQLEPDGNEHLFEFEYRKVDSIDEWEFEMLVESMADDYLHNHDGWEHRSWPNNAMEFWLYDDTKKMIGKFDVYLEFEPTFSARRVNG